MTCFTATNHSREVVAADRSEIWRALTDPDVLVELTPLLTDIQTDGNRWVWKMMGISALGVEVAPCFTEHMEFTPEERIEFTHTPPGGGTERAGADGVYRLEDHADGTLLDIEITISVDLPLPRVSRRAVERVMAQTMERTGNRFGRNLYAHLGVRQAA